MKRPYFTKVKSTQRKLKSVAITPQSNHREPKNKKKYEQKRIICLKILYFCNKFEYCVPTKSNRSRLWRQVWRVKAQALRKLGSCVVQTQKSSFFILKGLTQPEKKENINKK